NFYRALKLETFWRLGRHSAWKEAARQFSDFPTHGKDRLQFWRDLVTQIAAVAIEVQRLVALQPAQEGGFAEEVFLGQRSRLSGSTAVCQVRTIILILPSFPPRRTRAYARNWESRVLEAFDAPLDPPVSSAWEWPSYQSNWQT
ncbi:MAG: hypothetical protein J4N91_11325, partial [Chloroflexi bacterium]|nr:hypothetical protein [Chloroflexota bacterium]